eukprot:g12995.t1
MALDFEVPQWSNEWKPGMSIPKGPGGCEHPESEHTTAQVVFHYKEGDRTWKSTGCKRCGDLISFSQ